MKLLQKTIKSYILYSIIVLLIAVPVFYFSIHRILQHETDEDLLNTKLVLRQRLTQALNMGDPGSVDFLDEHITFQLSSSEKTFDSLFTRDRYDPMEKETTPYRCVKSNFKINEHYYSLIREVSLITNDDLIRSILTVEFLLMVILLSGLLLINRHLSKRIWKPFYQTLERLRNYNVANHSSLQLNKSSISEFSDLNHSLEELAERTHQTFVSQKEFTENASHEMQTPLAIFQTKLELLMQTSPLNEEQANLMDHLGDASQRMSRLIKSLILLAKIENNQFPDTEAVSINATLEYLLAQYAAQISEKQITVYSEMGSEIILRANRELLEILLSNIIGNAIRHNSSNGIINIFMSEQRLTVSNTGNGAALNPNKLFRRFQKESTDSSSIGLGLEIAKKISILNGFQIDYKFEDGYHVFVISFA